MGLFDRLDKEKSPDDSTLPPLRERIASAPLPREPGHRKPGETESPKPGDWVFLATLNENLIDKEWKLAGDRASLMVATQAFLFAAFVLILMTTDADREPVARRLLLTIPIIGGIIIVAASFGIFTAVAMARHLENERSYYQGVLERIFKIQILDMGSRRGRYGQKWYITRSRVMGTAPFVFVTGMLLILWVRAYFFAQDVNFPQPKVVETSPQTATISLAVTTKPRGPTIADGALAGAWVVVHEPR